MADTTRITRREWLNYIDRLSKINDKAADDVKRYVNNNGGTGVIDRDSLINYSYGVATKYGEASASLSAEMYDAVAALGKKNIASAIPADTPSYGEVAKTVNGILKQSEDINMLSSGVGRLVKRTGVDTVMKNALRDGAEWAWIPHGDTCAFCIALASRGWQKASKKALKNGHAEHIHANCDCTYAIRFGDDLEVEGYDPTEYQRMYYGAEGNTPEEKINSMRRMFYAQNKGIVGPESSKAEELLVKASTREDAYSILETMFGSVSDNVKTLDEALLVDNINQLNELNNKFKVISPDNIGYFTASPSGRAVAWTSTQYKGSQQNTNLSLVGRYYKKAQTLIDKETKGRNTFFCMPFSDDYLRTYTITHEYGHILESYVTNKRTDFEAFNARVSMYNPALQAREFRTYEKKIAKSITKEIIDIAKQNDPNFSLKDNLSRYGHTNDFEFFAEVFANSQCGKPNALGKAMLEWLKKEGF